MLSNISCRMLNTLGNYLAIDIIQGGNLLRCIIRHVDSSMTIQKNGISYTILPK